ncbi:unnamed protein product [Arabidopsis thaliana]|uniref:Uncharacterized protein n=3 Tax=Arabidopsis TaxID=3701 RepID=A0A178UBJ7_ARATH|nr:hypothetical protein ISN45_At05g061240 [Arabidopsis thaliana x Arabidopsis arenosa]KAG7614233.1 hypothetical protein ISN44_As05g060480 [Arabidopsis suecica]OAO91035.1 hypothetical protein AXX17_AT5G64620 [Arabidopsis thaliana]VYS71434.1 unnamed protein product [Arabidopsis thaliana]
MRKGTKKRGGSRGGSRGGRKTGASSSASKNDDAVVEATTTQETQPTQETEETEDKVESPAPEEEGKNEEEANENQEEEAAKVESKAAEEGGNEEEAKEDKEEEKEEAAREDKEEEEEAVKPDESASQKEEAKGASSSEPQLRRGKRKRGTKTEAEKKVSTPRAKKRAKTTKAQASEPEYFEEKRNLEDLWKATFSVGTEWDQQDALNEFNWDFTNLEEALEEGGELYGKQVYVFGCTESHSVTYKDENKDVLVPVVVCIDSPIPPSDEIGVASVQGEVGEIIAMKTMKMAWVPYIPLEQRDRQVDKKNFPIFILGCTQRRSALKHLPDDRVKKFNYCLPYINNPYKVDDSEKSTVVKIMFPSEPPVECEYDWVKSVIEEFTDSLINEEVLLPEQKVAFEEFVKEKSDKAMAAYDTAQEALEKAKEGLSEETKKAYQEMRLYKFYPLPSPDTPHTAGIEKSPFINRYFGKAHEVL